jgi:U3 small nucleolar RNA-associated protein 25
MTSKVELSDSLSEDEASCEEMGFFDLHNESNYPKIQELIKNYGNMTSSSIDGAVWKIPPSLDPLKLEQNLDLKPKLLPFLSKEESFSWLERALNGFSDVLFTGQTWENLTQLSSLISIYSLNRVLNARNRIVKNNAAADEGRECRDQGFTRPRVLILLPFKNSVQRYVNNLINLFESTDGQVENKSRFQEEYGLDEDELEEQRESFARKPEDFKNLFEGNTDDCFRLGIKITRKSLKLFSEFYQSDIIISSPLGLKLSIEGEIPEKKGKKMPKKTEDWDFLSSIEVLVIDQANIILMQNWDHLNFIYDLLNQIPKDPSKTDFSRVKSAYLEGQAGHLRQNILLSGFQFAELGNLSGKSKNIMGKVEKHLEYKSCVKEFETRGVKLLLHPVDCAGDASQEPELRLKYFEQNIFPKLQKYHHVAIFVSSYFDFLKLCKYLKGQEESAGYCSISEYSSPKETTKARAQFFNGNVKFLVTTERFHFYKRLKFRGIKKLFFYSLPECPEYFKELVDMLLSSDSKPGRRFELPILVTPLDYFKLERLVGSKKVKDIFSQ